MNPLGEEFRFHDSSRFRKKVGDAKFRFYHSFVPVLMSCCGVLPESGGVVKPDNGKALKEFQLCDSRRLRKKAQDAQDDVIKLFDLFHPVFWGWKGYRIWTPKGGPFQFSTWMFVSSFLPFLVSLFLVNF